MNLRAVKDPGSLGCARDDTRARTENRNRKQEQKTGWNEILTSGRSTSVAVETEARFAAANLGDSTFDLWCDRQVRERIDERLQP
jgi:hypothetical protein